MQLPSAWSAPRPNPKLKHQLFQITWEWDLGLAAAVPTCPQPITSILLREALHHLDTPAGQGN
jgi:hypothetical protein